jgi:Mu-like prophage fluMu protein gp16
MNSMSSGTYKTKKGQLIRLIHVGRQKVGLDEEAYRALLAGTTGKTSSTELSIAELEAVLKAFKRLGFQVKKMAARAEEVGRATAEQIDYIKGLWELSARVKTEAALNRFIKRITGVPYLRWLDVKTAQKVILAVRDIAVQAGYDPDGIPLKGSCCAEQ